MFKREYIAGNMELQRLLEEMASERPAKCQKRLCDAGFHTARKEISNYRDRMAKSSVVATDKGTLSRRTCLLWCSRRCTTRDVCGGSANPRQLTRQQRYLSQA